MRPPRRAVRFVKSRELSTFLATGLPPGGGGGKTAESMFYLAANIEALARAHPSMAETLRGQVANVQAAPYQVQGEPALDVVCLDESGQPQTLYGDGLDWSLRLARLRVVWRLDEECSAPETKDHSLLCIGFGLGPHLRPLLNQIAPEGRLAVFEPDPRLFFTSLCAVDLTDLLGDPRFLPITGLTPVRAVDSIGRELHWGRFLHLPHRLLIHPPTARLYPAATQAFKSVWKGAIERESLFAQASADAGETVTAHTVQNLPRLLDAPGVAPLFGRLRGVPALLAGAGPSLSSGLEDLRAADGRILILCVNSAYPVLRRAGVAPDLVIALDHQTRNLGSFDGIEHDPKTLLIADPRTDPRILQAFEGRTLLLSWHSTTEVIGEPAPPHAIPLARGGGNSLCHWLQQRLGEKGTISGAGSVAVAAYQLLAFWGCSPICLLGMDLAFPGEKRYADGTIFDDRALSRDDRIAHTVPDTNGAPVGTSSTLNLYRLLLEHECRRFAIPTVNASIGGARIAGAESRPLPDFLASLTPGRRPDTSALYDLARDGDACMGKRAPLDVALEILREDLSALAGSAAALCDRFCGAPLSPETVQEVETGLSNLKSVHPTGHFVLNELLQPVLQDYERDRWQSLCIPITERPAASVQRCLKAIERIGGQSSFLMQLIDNNRLDEI